MLASGLVLRHSYCQESLTTSPGSHGRSPIGQSSPPAWSAVALNLLIENSANRPAKNVMLQVDNTAINAAFADKLPEEDRDDIRACFSADFMILMLPNNTTATNAFGHLSFKEDTTVTSLKL